MNAQSSSSPKGPTEREWAKVHGTPWEVVFPAHGAVKRQRRFFATKEEGDAEIEKWQKDRKPEAGLGKRLVDEVVYVRAQLPDGVSLTDLLRFYLSHHAGLTTASVKDVADAYLGDIKAQKKSEDYQAEQIRWAGIFVKELGADTLFSALGKARLLKFIKADTESYWNRYSRKRIASCLITKAREFDAIKVNPLDGWTFEDAPKKSIHILTNEDAQVILDHAWEKRPDLVPSFALQLFAGIRTEELCRNVTSTKRPLMWTDIVIGEKITVPIEVSKTNDSRTVDYWPEALTHYLTALKKDVGRVCEYVELDSEKSKFIAELNEHREAQGLPRVDFRQNDFRRTYASNVCAAFENPGKAQLLLGHQENTTTFHRHYKAATTTPRAVAYFKSKPPLRISSAA